MIDKNGEEFNFFSYPTGKGLVLTRGTELSFFKAIPSGSYGIQMVFPEGNEPKVLQFGLSNEAAALLLLWLSEERDAGGLAEGFEILDAKLKDPATGLTDVEYRASQEPRE